MSAATSSKGKRTKLKKLDVLGDDDFDAVPDSEASELLKARQGQDKRGTTIVCIVGNGFFVIGADSYTHIDGELDELDKMKLHYICDGVVAAHAGYVHDGEIILKTVREQCEVVPPSSLEEVVSWTIKNANVYNDLRKVNPTFAFKGSAFIVGGKIPNSTNKMEAFLVFNDDGEGYRCFRSSSHLCDGSDSGSARMYIETNIHSITRERDDRMAIARHVLKALALAVILSEGSTGGDLNIVITREDGVREMYTVKQKEDGSYGDLVASDHQLEGL